MSIDLEWSKLDSSLSSKLVELLNRQLSSTNRPSFIGPVQVTFLEFGDVPPDVELVDLCDIYRDFLDSGEDESEPGPGKDPDEDDFEWVSRKGAAVGEEVYPTHLNGISTPFPPPSPWSRGLGSTNMMGLAGMSDYRPSYSPASAMYSLHRASTGTLPPLITQPIISSSHHPSPAPNASHPQAPEGTPEKPKSNHPDLQMHLHITWHSDLRITLTTSLLINYPSSMFMALPIKLSVTGLLFTGELAVAYEGSGSTRRVHLCILDEQDPYGPMSRSRRSRSTGDVADFPTQETQDEDGQINGGKPLPIGQRLLPSIYIESEIGQADKHVLKNVTRVERFVQDVIRKTVEEELVFPNFQTIVLGE
jgi:mitochondrial distribution and morphology protein 12